MIPFNPPWLASHTKTSSSSSPLFVSIRSLASLNLKIEVRFLLKVIWHENVPTQFSICFFGPDSHYSLPELCLSLWACQWISWDLRRRRDSFRSRTNRVLFPRCYLWILLMQDLRNKLTYLNLSRCCDGVRFRSPTTLISRWVTSNTPCLSISTNETS